MIDNKYQFVSQLYNSPNTTIHRAIQKQDHKSVILKKLNKEHPSPLEIALFHREYKITKDFNLSGVIKAYDFIENNNSYLFVLEDFGGISLNHLIFRNTPLLFNQLAIRMLDIIESVHQQNLIHKDINPSNWVWNPENNIIKLIDYGISTFIPKEQIESLPPEKLEGTIAYMSPEQTGRMNKFLDYRTDYYSLGVTFYEMISGKLPFQSDDPLDLIHLHLTHLPNIPNTNNPLISREIWPVLLKLMSKDPENRYQTIFSLKKDIEYCLNSKQMIPYHWIPGVDDYTDKMNIPQKLYGRDQDLLILKDTFSSVCQGESHLVIVRGSSGIGKTSFVRELQRDVHINQGYFISGKYDQNKNNQPYSAIFQALDQLVQKILSGGEYTIQTYKNKITKALDDNIGIISALIPSLELITGHAHAVYELSPSESKNRFHHIFQLFIKSLLDKDNPVVIFLDDLQWADSASLDLLENLFNNVIYPHLLLVITYRDDEVDSSHSLCHTLNQINEFQNISEKSLNTRVIRLKPLQLEHVNQFLKNCFNEMTTNTKSLSHILLEKTNGNPFFITQLLKAIYQEKNLQFNRNTRKWEWNIDNIRNIRYTDNIITLLVNKIKTISQESIELLKLSSCIGKDFDLETLSLIYNETPYRTAKNLSELIYNELIIPLGNEYKYILKGNKGLEAKKVRYQFIHDRVQQASYDLLDEDMKSHLHLKIARILIKHRSKEDLEESPLEITNHFNQAVKILDDEDEKLLIAEWNLKSGRQVKEQLDFKMALNYFTTGISLLNEDHWNTHYDLTYNLYIEKGESDYLNNNYEIAEKIMESAINHSKSRNDKAKAYIKLIKVYFNSSNYKKAIDLASQGLILYGVEPPDLKQINIKGFLKEMSIEFKNLFLKITYKDILAREIETDEIPLITLNLYDSLLIPYYQIGELKSLAYYSTRFASYFLNNRISKYTSISLINFALMVIVYFEDYKLAYKLSEIALELDKKFNFIDIKSKMFTYFGAFVNIWIKHIKTSKFYFERAYQTFMQANDMWIPYAAVNHFYMHRYFEGEKLDTIIKGYEDLIQPLKNIVNNEFIILNIFHLNFYRNLKGITNNHNLLDSKYFNVNETMNKLYNKIFPTSSIKYFCLKSWLFYYFEKYQDALKEIRTAGKIKYSVKIQLFYTEHIFIYTLTLAALFPKANPQEKKKYLRILHKNLKLMNNWSDHCPDNFLYKYQLMMAEYHRIRGKHIEAIEYYHMGIDNARKYEFLHHEALGHELFAKFWLEKGYTPYARHHLRESISRYEMWGADAKVRHLEEKYPDLLTSSNTGINPLMINTTTEISPLAFEKLDLMTVIKASQSLSGDLQLNELLKTMMRIMIQHAGAQKACFVLIKNDQPFIEASVDKNSNIEIPHIPLDQYNEASRKMINYVIQTKQPIIFDNAYEEGFFTDDPYVMANQVKSVLCLPIIKQDFVKGILYLENNYLKGLFASHRLKLIELLSSQILISLENAIYYETLKENEKEFSRLTTKIHNSIKNKIDSTRSFLSLYLRKNKVDIELVNIQNILTHCSNESKNILYITENRYCTLKELSDELQFRATMGLSITKIRHKTTEVLKNPNQQIKTEILQAILDIHSEILNNIIKHSQATEVIIHLAQKKDQLILSVRDNGIGFEITKSAEKRSSYGMTILKDISKEVNGELIIESSAAEGTNISFTVKI